LHEQDGATGSKIESAKNKMGKGQKHGIFIFFTSTSLNTTTSI